MMRYRIILLVPLLIATASLAQKAQRQIYEAERLTLEEHEIAGEKRLTQVREQMHVEARLDENGELKLLRRTVETKYVRVEHDFARDLVAFTDLTKSPPVKREIQQSDLLALLELRFGTDFGDRKSYSRKGGDKILKQKKLKQHEVIAGQECRVEITRMRLAGRVYEWWYWYPVDDNVRAAFGELQRYHYEIRGDRSYLTSGMTTLSLKLPSASTE